MRKAAGALVVFDLTSRTSFDTAIEYINDMTNLTKTDTQVILVGNKLDLVEKDPKLREIQFSEVADSIKGLATEFRVRYMETSAHYSYNEVSSVFRQLIKSKSDKLTSLVILKDNIDELSKFSHE